MLHLLAVQILAFGLYAAPAGAEPALSALRNLAQENLANLNPHPLYILIHYSHPPIPERLRAINQLGG